MRKFLTNLQYDITIIRYSTRKPHTSNLCLLWHDNIFHPCFLAYEVRHSRLDIPIGVITQ